MNFTQFGSEMTSTYPYLSPLAPTSNRESSSKRTFTDIPPVDISSSRRRPVIDSSVSSRPFITSTSVQPSRIDDILLQKRRQSLLEFMHLNPRISRFTQLVNKSNYSKILNSKHAFGGDLFICN